MEHIELLQGARANDLTDKQCEVLDLVLTLKSNKEIARDLGISPSAVEQRLASVRAKFGVNRRADLVRAYLAYKAICAVHTCAPPQVVTPAPSDETSPRERPEPVLHFSDSMSPGGMEFDGAWFAGAGHPREFKMPDSPYVRLAMIVVFALVIAVTALVATSVAQVLADIVRF